MDTLARADAATSAARSTTSYRLGLAALLVASALVLLAGNGGSSVFDRDEARFALAVREMRARGEFVVPTNWGKPRTHKPILAYWLALGSERVLGPGEFAWRLPSALCGLLSICLTAAIARSLFGERAGLRAGAILATALVFVLESKILTSDATLLASTTLSFWAWLRLRGATRRAPLWRFLFWLGVGLGLLAKAVNVAFLIAAGCALSYLRSPWSRRGRTLLFVALGLGALAVSFPGIAVLGPLVLALVALCFLIVELRSSAVESSAKRLGWSWGVPLALAIAALWFVPALVRTHGSFWSEGVGHHLLGRTVTPFEGHRALPGYYLLTTVAAFFPWAAFLPAALAQAWREARSQFLLAWILGPWILDELIASKLPHYVLVTFPALAVLVAAEWERRAHGESRPTARIRVIETALFAIPCLLLAVAGALLWRLEHPTIRALALALVVLALVLAARVAQLQARGLSERLFSTVLAGALALYLLLFLGLFPALEPLRIAPALGAAVARLGRPAEPIHLIEFRPESLGCTLPAGHPVVEDQTAVTRALAGARPGLFLVPNDARDPRFERIRAQYPGAWEVLAQVRGILFPRLAEREIWIVRRE